MKAVALNYSTRRLEERDIAEPQIVDPRDVLLQIREVGICGTDRDLAAFRLAFPPGGDDYLVLGHECVAEVVRTGSAVTAVNRRRHRSPYRPATVLSSLQLVRERPPRSLQHRDSTRSAASSARTATSRNWPSIAPQISFASPKTCASTPS